MAGSENRLHFSSEYSALRHQASMHVREKREDQLDLNERFVACLWFSGKYLGELKTVDGRSVKVISPGIWNLEEGPDFRRAAVVFDDGEPVTGDVEIHLFASDWSGHQHHRREEYSGVVLNVSMWNNTRKEHLPSFSGEGLPHVELAQSLTRPLKSIVNLIQTDDYPYRKDYGKGRCVEVLESLKKNEVFRLLQMAGEWRLQEKAARYGEWLSDDDYDELLYKALMETMGYHDNKEAFLALADRIPYRDVKRLLASESGRASKYLVQSVLMNISGLFPEKPETHWDSESVRFHKFIRELWLDFSESSTYMPLDPSRWKIRGRPTNSPLRRISAMSHFIFEHRAGSPFGRLLSVLKSLAEIHTRFGDEYTRFTRKLTEEYYAEPDKTLKKQYGLALDRLRNVIQPGEDKFWSRRYTLGGRKLAKPTALIGEQRLNEICINVIMPMALLYARRHMPDLENMVYVFCQFLPKLQENKITRLMKHRLFGKDRKKLPPESAITQQGLLQLFKDFCSQDKGGCLECGFISNVEHWAEYKLRRA